MSWQPLLFYIHCDLLFEKFRLESALLDLFLFLDFFGGLHLFLFGGLGLSFPLFCHFPGVFVDLRGKGHALDGCLLLELYPFPLFPL